jgi:hypothetical protein
MPTFWVLGTRAPITMPIGNAAIRPRINTHTTVSQPDASAINPSKSRKLGSRITTSWGTRLSD